MVTDYRSSFDLQLVNLFVDQVLASFFPTDFLGVSDRIDGCAGLTVVYPMVRRFHRWLYLQILLKKTDYLSFFAMGYYTNTLGNYF